MAPVEPALAIRLGLEGLGRVVAHLDHLGGRNDSEPLGGTSLRSEHGLNFLFIAEQHDTAVRPDRIERHDGSLDSRFGSEIAPHGIHTYS